MEERAAVFLLPFEEQSNAETVAAVFRAVAAVNLWMPTIFGTGPMVVKPACVTWCYFAEDITAWCMKAVSVCKPGQMEKSISLIRMDGPCHHSPMDLSAETQTRSGSTITIVD